MRREKKGGPGYRTRTRRKMRVGYTIRRVGYKTRSAKNQGKNRTQLCRDIPVQNIQSVGTIPCVGEVVGTCVGEMVGAGVGTQYIVSRNIPV